jgi:hypothetical protein
MPRQCGAARWSRTRARLMTRVMSTSDLKAVTERRAEIASHLGGYDAKVAALHVELEELAVTERVLHRLEQLMPEDPADYPDEYASAEPLAQRTVSAIKTLLARRNS